MCHDQIKYRLDWNLRITRFILKATIVMIVFHIFIFFHSFNCLPPNLIRLLYIGILFLGQLIKENNLKEIQRLFIESFLIVH